MSSPTELKAQLARTEQALLEAEKEIDRQRRATAEAAAEGKIPEGAKALIAAISKVDLPAFWDADPVLWFRQCESAFRRAGTVSSGVKFDHVVGKLPNAVSLSCVHSCRPSTSRTRTPTSGSKSTFAKTTASLNGNKGTLYWTIPASATAGLPSCYRTCEPSYLTKKQKASCSSVSSSSVCRHPCPTPSWPPGWRTSRTWPPWPTACRTNPPPPASPPSPRNLPPVHTCRPSTADRGSSTALAALRTALAALQTAAQPRPDPEKTKRTSPPFSPPGGQPASG
jgi:hypothetical protein